MPIKKCFYLALIATSLITLLQYCILNLYFFNAFDDLKSAIFFLNPFIFFVLSFNAPQEVLIIKQILTFMILFIASTSYMTVAFCMMRDANKFIKGSGYFSLFLYFTPSLLYFIISC